MKLQISPITEDKLLPDYMKQDTWKATLTFDKSNGKTVEVYETGDSPEIAKRRLFKLIGF